MKHFLVALSLSLFILGIHAQTSKSPQTVYSNPASITINTNPAPTYPKPASLYPSTINVSGMTGNITNLKVSLKGINNLNQSFDMLLVSPSGAKFILASDNGFILGNNEDYVLTISDTPAQAPSIFPYNNNNGTDTFPSPAPAGPYINPGPTGTATLASTFNGTNPNGAWQLFIVNDEGGLPGSLNSGWFLTITTNGSPAVFSNSSYVAMADTITTATPYSSNINVSGATGIVSKVTVSLNGLTHSQAFDIGVLLVSPNGIAVNLMSRVGLSASSANVTFDDAALNNIENSLPIISGTYKPSTNGTPFFINPAPNQFAPILSSFNDLNPNGDWKLFVIDELGNTNSGAISGGWSLNITTIPNVPISLGCFVPTFNQAINFPAGSNPTNLAVGDFNNDNRQDFAVTNQVSSNVSILLGSGTGTFTSGATLAAGSNPYAVAVGRFNADTNNDLAVVNSNSNNVSIFLGNGNGTFSAATNFSVGASPIAISVGDFNSDNIKDLAVANFGGFFSGTISILQGNGTGGFTAARDLRARTQPSAIVTGRFNSDAIDDLAVTNFGSDNISVYLGFGNGTFSNQSNINVFSGPVAITTFDADNNGIQDLITANFNNDTVSLRNGVGNGTFTGSESTPVGVNPVSLTTADFVGSGINPQVAIASNGSDKVVFSNTNSPSPNEYTVGVYPNSIVKGDFNGDGKPDLATANSGSNNVSVLINSCRVAKGNLFDFDSDRKTDFNVYRPSNLNWYNLNTPAGEYYARSRPGDLIVPADYDGNGRTDYGVYRPETGVWITGSSQSFPFYPIHNFQFGIAIDIPVPADFDGDGKADIAVWRPTDGRFYIRTSSNNGFIAFPFGTNGDIPVPSDFDGDGKADYAVFRPSTGIWYIWYSQTNSFGAFNFGQIGDKVVPADYDGDGKTDIAVFRAGFWYVLRSSNGSFYGSQFGTATDIPAPGDYDGDSKFDQAVFRNGTWYVLNSSNGQLQVAEWGSAGDIPVPSAYVR
jgi:subtilisin-like proprotein convertase family protein